MSSDGQKAEKKLELHEEVTVFTEISKSSGSHHSALVGILYPAVSLHLPEAVSNKRSNWW